MFRDQKETKLTHYKILGVKQDATPEEIKRAYRRQALKVHPDKHLEGKKVGEEKFKELCDSYQILNDPDQRTVYDASLKRMPDFEKRISDLQKSFANFSSFWKPPQKAQQEKQKSTPDEKAPFPSEVKFSLYEKVVFDSVFAGMRRATEFNNLSRNNLLKHGTVGFKFIEDNSNAKQVTSDAHILTKELEEKDLTSLSQQELAFLAYHYCRAGDLIKAEQYSQSAKRTPDDKSVSLNRVTVVCVEAYIERAKEEKSNNHQRSNALFAEAAAADDPVASLELMQQDMQTLLFEVDLHAKKAQQQELLDKIVKNTVRAAKSGILNAIANVAYLFGGDVIVDYHKNYGNSGKRHVPTMTVNRGLEQSIWRKAAEEKLVNEEMIRSLANGLLPLFQLHSHEGPDKHSDDPNRGKYGNANGIECPHQFVRHLGTLAYHGPMLCVNNPNIWDLIEKAHKAANPKLIELSGSSYDSGVMPLDKNYFQRALTGVFCDTTKKHPDKIQQLFMADMMEAGYQPQHIRTRVIDMLTPMFNYLHSRIDAISRARPPIGLSDMGLEDAYEAVAATATDAGPALVAARTHMPALTASTTAETITTNAMSAATAMAEAIAAVDRAEKALEEIRKLAETAAREIENARQSTASGVRPR